MIVLPIIFTFIMVYVMYFVFVGTTGMNPLSLGQSGLLILDQTRANMLLQGENPTEIARDVVVYQLNTGTYVLVLPEYLGEHVGRQGVSNYNAAIMFVILLLIVFLINRFLTKYITRHIMTAVNTLVNGVSEIRDGNLEYRIKYIKGDEFDAVCNDFNDMAGRLLEMVNAKRLDEENRKELIAGISHDLRTPLTSIKTYVEGIELGMAHTPELQKEYFDTIKGKTKDIEHIINQLFMFSKLDIGEFPMLMQQGDAGEWIDDFVGSVSDEYARKGLQIRLARNVQAAEISVDSVQLRNVLINILENSLKYGNKDNGIMDITCSNDNGYVLISLTDNGNGVPSDYLEKLFEIFYRTDKARNNTSQGSGLGLAISAKIMERLGGSISAENANQGGLSVILKIPIIKGDGI